MRERVVLIGAGSAMFTRGLVADLVELGEACDLCLVDTDPEALLVAERLSAKMVAARGAPIRIEAAVDRRDVLGGSTVIICTVGVGGRRAWEQDVFIPRQYGIYQPVGDSVMPGGASRALRMIPAMVAIAEDVFDLAPEALFFNYGNPMAPVCRAVRKATGADMVGLCHGAFHVASYLAEALGVPEGRFRATGVGMNHLTWFVEARVDGVDAMPRLREIARAKLAEVREGRSTPEQASPFSWELLLLFGAFPAPLDRHVTEFFPQLYANGSYYGKQLGVDAYSLEGTTARGDEIYAQMREQALGEAPLPTSYFERSGGEHEQVLDIIRSIRRDEGRIYWVNLPNRGQAPNLPAEAIVESPAVADGAGLRPIAQPPLPAGIVGTLATRMAWVETVVEAALEGSRDKFVQALLLDGAVSSVQMARALAADLLAAQARYLPQFAAPK
jgi:alpha-galactosidase